MHILSSSLGQQLIKDFFTMPLIPPSLLVGAKSSQLQPQLSQSESGDLSLREKITSCCYSVYSDFFRRDLGITIISRIMTSTMEIPQMMRSSSGWRFKLIKPVTIQGRIKTNTP